MPVSIEKGAHVDSGTGAYNKDHVARSHENPTAELVNGSEGVEIHGRHTTTDLLHEDGPTGAHTSAIKRTYVQWPAEEDEEKAEDEKVEVKPEPKAIKAVEVEDKSIKAASAETA